MLFAVLMTNVEKRRQEETGVDKKRIRKKKKTEHVEEHTHTRVRFLRARSPPPGCPHNKAEAGISSIFVEKRFLWFVRHRCEGCL